MAERGARRGGRGEERWKRGGGEKQERGEEGRRSVEGINPLLELMRRCEVSAAKVDVLVETDISREEERRRGGEERRRGEEERVTAGKAKREVVQRE
eukprot:764540-Hanusia_phi.AAC.2